MSQTDSYKPYQYNDLQNSSNSTQQTPYSSFYDNDGFDKKPSQISLNNNNIKTPSQILDLKPFQFQVTQLNVLKILNIMNKFRLINPLVLKQFTFNHTLPISPQPKQMLYKKNEPFLQTTQGPLVFSNLLNDIYLRYTPESFQRKYLTYQKFFNRIYNFYFLGIAGFIFWSRRANKKHLWWKLTKSSSFVFNSVISIWAISFVINQFYMSGLKRLCKNNIQIVDSVFDTHLRVIHAHGVDVYDPGLDVMTINKPENSPINLGQAGGNNSGLTQAKVKQLYLMQNPVVKISLTQKDQSWSSPDKSNMDLGQNNSNNSYNNSNNSQYFSSFSTQQKQKMNKNMNNQKYY